MNSATGRVCGDCSLCCKLLEIEELGKPEGQWCRHCRPGAGGCTVYEERPRACQTFSCRWLLNPGIGDAWLPTKCRMVVFTATDQNMGGVMLAVYVDPGSPNVWRGEPHHGQLVEWARAGLRAGLFRVFVHVRERAYLVLPSRDVEITGKIIGIVRRPDGDWDVRFFENAEEARLFRERTNQFSTPGIVNGENKNQ
jgi:hypothetical protein